jgi:ribonucleotide reductase beta subunit family protein with ferritin-like domain
MPGLSYSNELISHNKGLHCDFACLLYSKLINRLPEACIVEIISSAVNIEMEFVVDALLVKLIGMNSTMMCNYIKFCADSLLITLGCCRHYKTGNPFEWMEMICPQGKTNFFKKRVREYVCVCVCLTSSREGLPSDAMPIAGQIHPPPTPATSYPLQTPHISLSLGRC